MGSIQKTIFGKTVSIDFDDSLADLVLGSVRGYAGVTSPEPGDIRLDIRKSANESDAELISSNPSAFLRYGDSVLTKFSFIDVRWKCADARPYLSACVSFAPGRFKLSLRQRLQTMEYSNELELFEQVLHERVFIPAMYFFPDRAIVHSAAVAVSGKAVLLTGTGGTGKTSALLSLRREQSVEFLADDIAVIAPDGRVFPNLAWPKIYGYNLGDSIQKSVLLRRRSFLDKLHFNVRHRSNPSKVRRKLRPEELYDRVALGGVSLGSALFLFRENRSSILVQELSASAAVQMTLAVMFTEYFDFHRFYYWDEFNALALGKSRVLNLDAVTDAWRRNLLDIFSRVQVRIVRIPLRMRHEDYLAEIRALALTFGESPNDGRSAHASTGGSVT